MKDALSDLFAHLGPDTVLGALVYFLLAVLVATTLSRALRAAVHVAMTRRGHLDFTTISFLQQFGSALIWVAVLILYANFVPMLRSMGTALLAGASIASVVIGLAAQSTLGNLVAGVSITIYRPFKLNDTLQVATPTGTEIGVVEIISLGYTTLRTADGRRVVLPNSLAASQVTLNLTERNASHAADAVGMTVTIRVPRGSDLDAARAAAIEAADRVQPGDSGSITACELVRIDAADAVLELHCRVGNEPLAAARSRLLTALAARFAAIEPGATFA